MSVTIQDVRTILIAGGITDTIDFALLRQGATTGVVLNVVTELEPVTHDGDKGLSEQTIQVDCYGKTYAEMSALYVAVRDVLNGHTSGTVQGIFLARARDLFDTESELHRRTADVTVWNKEG